MGGGKSDFLPEIDLNINSNSEINVDANADMNVDAKADMKADVKMDLSNVHTTSALNATMTGAKEAPIAMMVLGDEKQPASANITGDKDRPLAMSFELQNLPRFGVKDIREMLRPKVRFCLPSNHQLCVKLFGVDVLSVCFGGEGQLIAKPYECHETECREVTVCDVDTRPFPGSDVG